MGCPKRTAHDPTARRPIGTAFFPMLRFATFAAGGFCALKCSHNHRARCISARHGGAYGPRAMPGWSGFPPDAVSVFPSATQGAHPPATSGSCVVAPTHTDRTVKAVLMRRSLSCLGTLPMDGSRLAGESSREPLMVAVANGSAVRTGLVRSCESHVLVRQPAGSLALTRRDMPCVAARNGPGLCLGFRSRMRCRMVAGESENHGPYLVNRI